MAVNNGESSCPLVGYLFMYSYIHMSAGLNILMLYSTYKYYKKYLFVEI